MGETPVATIRIEPCGLSIFYIHTDHLNTPRRITRRSTADVVWSWESDPFGTTAPNENASGLGTFSFNLRFPGQYYDSETGQNYNYYRDYDPATGRYVESDPLGLKAGVNTYSYIGGNPVSRIDPRGLSAKDVSAILQNIEQNFPEIQLASGWEFGAPGPENSANTDPWSGEITVDNKYSKACLGSDEFNTLYFDLLHEAMHSTDSPDKRMWDNEVEFWGGVFGHQGLNTSNHQAIYNRVQWEEWGNLPSPYTAQVWGYRPGERRSQPISPKVQMLYGTTRPCSCGN